MDVRKRFGIHNLGLDKFGLEEDNNITRMRNSIFNKKEKKVFNPIKGKLREINEKLNNICSNLDSIHEKINKRLELIENKIIKKLENDNYYTVDQLCHIEEKLINLKREITEDSDDEDDEDLV